MLTNGLTPRPCASARQPAFWYTRAVLGLLHKHPLSLWRREEGPDSAGHHRRCAALGDKPAALGLWARHLRKKSPEKVSLRVIDCLVAYIKAHIPLSEIRYISGGERRDWFFSLPVARRLGCPTLRCIRTSAVLSDKETHRPITAMEPGAARSTSPTLSPKPPATSERGRRPSRFWVGALPSLWWSSTGCKGAQRCSAA